MSATGKKNRRGHSPISRMDLDEEAMDILLRIAERCCETAAESLAAAISIGLDREALEQGWSDVRRWRGRTAVKAHPLGGLAFGVRILPGAVELVERYRRWIEREGNKMAGGVIKPAERWWHAPDAAPLCGALTEGLADLERMTLGSRWWNHVYPAAAYADAAETHDPGNVVQLAARRGGGR